MRIRLRRKGIQHLTNNVYSTLSMHIIVSHVTYNLIKIRDLQFNKIIWLISSVIQNWLRHAVFMSHALLKSASHWNNVLFPHIYHSINLCFINRKSLVCLPIDYYWNHIENDLWITPGLTSLKKRARFDWPCSCF